MFLVNEAKEMNKPIKYKKLGFLSFIWNRYNAMIEKAQNNRGVSTLTLLENITLIENNTVHPKTE